MVNNLTFVFLFLKEEGQTSDKDGQEDGASGGQTEEESPSHFTFTGVELREGATVSFTNTLEVVLVPAQYPKKDGNSIYNH